MGAFKRTALYVLLLLFLYVVYQDFTVAADPPPLETDIIQAEDINFQILQIKVKPGDTVLTIAEEIHSTSSFMQTDQLLSDFKRLNPTADPYALKAGTFYYFPLYE